MREQSIFIIGQDDFQASLQSKGILNIPQLKCEELPLDNLYLNLNTFIGNISAILDKTISPTKDYELAEIELKVDVSITGSVRLIGSVEAGTTGGIALKFKRKQTNE